MGGEQAERDVDLSVIGSAEGDGGVPHGAEIMAFVDAALSWDPDATAVARARLEAATGEAGLIDTAAVAAIFQLNTRAADSIGLPVEERSLEMRGAVGEMLGFEAREDGLAP